MIHRQDDTFVIDFNGIPYHLTPDCEPGAGMYEATLEQYNANPAGFEEEYPPEPLPQSEIRKGEILAILAALDAQYLTVRTLAGLAVGDAYALAQWHEHEQLAAPLRAELAGLL